MNQADRAMDSVDSIPKEDIPAHWSAEYVGGGTVLFRSSDVQRPRATAGVSSETEIRRALGERDCHWKDTKAALNNRLRGDVAKRIVSRAESETQ